MQHKNWNFALVIFSILFCLCLMAGDFVLADDILDRLNSVGSSADYTSVGNFEDITLAKYVGQIISYILAMLGVIFLCLLVYGGFIWMLAKGDSEEVNKAKDIIFNAVIGIIIVLISYAITYYVVANLASATMTTDSGFAP